MLLILGSTILCGHALAGQARLRATRAAKKKGWGNIVDSDGGADVEYGEQTVSEKNDFCEKQYESDDPNDDENGYTGDYNTRETDHPDDESEEEETPAGEADDENGYTGDYNT